MQSSNNCLVCLLAGLPIARAAGNAQTPWLEAIEERLAATAKALGSMKAIRMTGLADIVSSRIAKLRLAEIRASRLHRVLNIFVFVICKCFEASGKAFNSEAIYGIANKHTRTDFASSALAPVWGFTVYILLARTKDTGTLNEGVAFAALSVFELLNEPMINAIDGFEHIQTVMNSFRRIQEYLLSTEREDYRITPASETSSLSTSVSKPPKDVDVQLDDYPKSNLVDAEFAVIVNDTSASYALGGVPVLKTLTFCIPQGQTTIIFGPVGSGKSTLLKLLLGEMPSVSGSVTTCFSTAAYCPQYPWSTWGSVRNNIVGMSAWDEKWYNTVISACALSSDFKEMANGDQTPTGTRGSRLSGGQQIRVVSIHILQ